MKPLKRIAAGLLITIVLLASTGLTLQGAASEVAQVNVEEESAIGTDEPGNPENSPTYATKTVDRIHFIALNSDGYSSDAILVESNGQYGLIDASHPSGETVVNRYPEFTGKGANGQTVVQYLCGTVGLDHLSFVIGTHSHSDHIGGIPDIAAAGIVDENTVYIYKDYECGEQYDWHNDYYAALALKMMQEKGAALLDLTTPSERGLSLLGAEMREDPIDSTGDRVEFYFGDFLITLFNLHTESTENENLNSIITVIRKGDESTVLMSDMEMTDGMEDRVVNAVIRNTGITSADVYKVAHHGLPNSNGVGAFAAFNPRYAIVSTSRTAKDPLFSADYNYILEKTGAEIYRTSEAEAGIVAVFSMGDVSIYKMKYNGMLDAASPWVTTYQTN